MNRDEPFPTVIGTNLAGTAALGVPSNDQVHVRPVDRSGTTHWRADGAFDAAKVAALDAVLEE